MTVSERKRPKQIKLPWRWRHCIVAKHPVRPLIHGIKAQQIRSLVACPSISVYLDIVRRIIKSKKRSTKSLRADIDRPYQFLPKNPLLNNFSVFGLSVDDNKVYLHNSSINHIGDNKALTVRDSRTPSWNPLLNNGVCVPLYVLFCPEYVQGLQWASASSRTYVPMHTILHGICYIIRSDSRCTANSGTWRTVL